MSTRLLLAKIRAGQVGQWTDLWRDLGATRRRDLAESNRRHGVRRLSVWMSDARAGLGVLACELDDGATWPESLGASPKEFDRWLGSRFRELTSAMEPLQELLDTRPARLAWREWRPR